MKEICGNLIFIHFAGNFDNKRQPVITIKGEREGNKFWQAAVKLAEGSDAKRWGGGDRKARE